MRLKGLYIMYKKDLELNLKVIDLQMEGLVNLCPEFFQITLEDFNKNISSHTVCNIETVQEIKRVLLRDLENQRKLVKKLLEE